MKIVWTKESLGKFIEIEDFIAGDNPNKAIEFINFLIEKTDVIKENPKIGRVVPEFSNPILRELIVNNYRIVYRIDKSKIEILTVFEGHRLIRRDEIIKNE
jgi:addiction module RelE/StbE family toxin